MSELPPNWIRTPLGSFTIECNQRVPEQNEEFKYIDISSVNRDNKHIENPQLLIGKDAPSRARKHVQSGDVLVSMTRPNLNAVALVPDELNGQIASTGFDVLRTPGIDPRWVFNLVRTTDFVEAMSDLVQGALYPAVRSKDIRGFEAPFAPLNEQKRIADKLDAILARVDACRERLDRIPAILKRFRQTVLIAATSGELANTENNAPITQSATMLLQDALVSIKTGPFGSALHKADYVKSGIPVINPMHIIKGRIFSSSDMSVSKETLARLADFCLSEGDVIIGRRGEMGRCAVVKEKEHGWLCGTGSMILKPVSGLDPNYLQLFLSSEKTIRALEAKSVGSTMINLNQRILLALEIYYPSLSEQTEIVRRVESLFAYADRLEAHYATARAKVDQLTPAILAKAFRGELVPQDPDDEPASVLLERIRKAAPAAKQRGRSKTNPAAGS